MLTSTRWSGVICGISRSFRRAGKRSGYKRAAAAILRLETALTELRNSKGTLPKIVGIGPGSLRVIHEILESGSSVTVERAIDASGQREDIERRRTLRRHFLSRAEVVRILNDSRCEGPASEDYRGDFQMHSEWSDGNATLEDIHSACQARGYAYAAVTDHWSGLKIAGGISMQEAEDQRRVIDQINAETGNGFRLLQGIEANIGSEGRLNLHDEEAAFFEIVLAAPHSKLRLHPGWLRLSGWSRRSSIRAVRILAHPRGRITGSRAGVVARWDSRF